MKSIRRSLSSIAFQIALSQIVTVTVTIILIGGVLSSLSFRAQMTQLRANQQSRAESISVKISAYIDDLHDELAYLARIRGLTGLDAETQYNLLDALTHHNSAYNLIGLTDRNGALVQAVSLFGEKASRDWSATAAFRRAVQAKEDYVGPVEQTDGSTWPTLIMALPIRDADNQVDGLLFAKITLRFLWAVLDESMTNQPGYVYVVDNRQFVIARSGIMPDQTTFQDLSGTPLNTILAFGRELSPNTYTGLNQIEVIGNAAAVSTTNWRVIVEIPATVAYAPATTLLIVMTSGLFAGLLLAISIGVLISRRIVSPLQNLTDAAQRISNGELGIVLGVDHALELSVLATAFNQMSAQLQEMIKRLQEDITGRKLTENLLRERQRFIERILELIPDIIYIFDIDETRNVFASHEMVHVLGYTESDIHQLGNSIMDRILMDEDKQQYPERIARLKTAADADVLIHEQPFISKAGDARWFQIREVVFSRNADGQPREILGAMVEITERRQAERDLREINATLEQRIEERVTALHRQQVEFSTLVNAMGEGMFHIENDVIKYANTALCMMFGYSMEELTGKSPEILIVGWGKTQTEIHRGEQAPPDTVLRGEMQGKRKDGSTFIVGFSVSQIADIRDTEQSEVNGAINGKYHNKRRSAVAVIRDITESKTLEQNLQRALDHEKELSQLKSRFVSIVSHEFRTPLASIQLTSDMLKLYSDRFNDDQRREKLEKIQGDIRRMTQMLEDILTFNRVEAGRLALKRTPVDVVEFCQSCLKTIRSLVGNYEFEFKKFGTIQSDVYIVNLDRELLDHVLMNLLNNAVKYSPIGGTVHLTLRVDSHEVTFEVRDEGIGIPLQDQAHLFEPFHRASNVGQISGTGLGLTIVKELVELHKGIVTVETAEEIGTKFTVTIPVD